MRKNAPTAVPVSKNVPALIPGKGDPYRTFPQHGMRQSATDVETSTHQNFPGTWAAYGPGTFQVFKVASLNITRMTKDN